jgi:2-haloacid dehalogenase
MRWATFDCYGTLIDWNRGVGAELERLFGGDRRERLLERYHQIEPEVQAAEPGLAYREVMARVLERIASEEGGELADEERDALGRSLPSWRAFPEVRAALEEARQRGWKLVILSNSDRDLIQASMETIGVPFEFAVVASEIGSYKPAHGHWVAFRERVEGDVEAHVHVAQSNFHDIGPANELGLRSVWINRDGEQGEHQPTRELSDLTGLADALDDLAPAAGR